MNNVNCENGRFFFFWKNTSFLRFLPFSGSSTKTRSPRAFWAKSVIPIVASLGRSESTFTHSCDLANFTAKLVNINCAQRNTWKERKAAGVCNRKHCCLSLVINLKNIYLFFLKKAFFLNWNIFWVYFKELSFSLQERSQSKHHLSTKMASKKSNDTNVIWL